MTLEMIREFQNTNGWTDDTMLHLLAVFIDEHKLGNKLAKMLNSIEAEESED